MIKLKFNEIKAKAEKLTYEFKALPVPAGEDLILASIYDEKIVKEKQAMIDFFRSFDDAKEFMLDEYHLDAPQFNELAGFTLEYRDICYR
jgi:hypothetical protein